MISLTLRLQASLPRHSLNLVSAALRSNAAPHPREVVPQICNSPSTAGSRCSSNERPAPVQIWRDFSLQNVRNKSFTKHAAHHPGLRLQFRVRQAAIWGQFSERVGEWTGWGRVLHKPAAEVEPKNKGNICSGWIFALADLVCWHLGLWWAG